MYAAASCNSPRTPEALASDWKAAKAGGAQQKMVERWRSSHDELQASVGESQAPKAHADTHAR